MRFEIIGDGLGGTVDDYIGLYVFKKLLYDCFIPYICGDEMIVASILRKDIRMQGTSCYLILCLARQVIQYLASGESIGTDNYYILHGLFYSRSFQSYEFFSVT